MALTADLSSPLLLSSSSPLLLLSPPPPLRAVPQPIYGIYPLLVLHILHLRHSLRACYVPRCGVAVLAVRAAAPPLSWDVLVVTIPAAFCLLRLFGFSVCRAPTACRDIPLPQDLLPAISVTTYLDPYWSLPAILPAVLPAVIPLHLPPSPPDSCA